MSELNLHSRMPILAHGPLLRCIRDISEEALACGSGTLCADLTTVLELTLLLLMKRERGLFCLCRNESVRYGAGC